MSEDRSVLSRKAPEPDEELRYGDHVDQVIDYWHAKEYRPLVVFVHGGFWRPQYDRVHARSLGAALSDLGWPVVSLEYRREPGNPDVTTSDIRTALEALPDLVDVHAGYVLIGTLRRRPTRTVGRVDAQPGPAPRCGRPGPRSRPPQG